MSAELSPELFALDMLLRSAARDFAYPRTPTIAAVVSARLREETAPRRPAIAGRLWAAPMWRLAAGAAIALVLALGVSIALPRSREALAHFFGLSHVRVEIGPVVGSTPPVLSPDSFAEPSDVTSAQARLDFPLRYPTRDGVRLEPKAVYVEFPGSTAPVVIFTYDDYDLYETKQGFFGKGGPDPSLIHEIEFDGHAALWIDQGGHIAESYDALGRLVVESLRTVDRATLLWEDDGGVTYRLETSLTQAKAIEVARSLR
jgi:hypothetical protein